MMCMLLRDDEDSDDDDDEDAEVDDDLEDAEDYHRSCHHVEMVQTVQLSPDGAKSQRRPLQAYKADSQQGLL